MVDSLPQMCNEYAKYIKFDEINSEQTKTIKDTVEHILTQLDELGALVDTVRLNVETTQSLMPTLLAKTNQLEMSFALIDAFEVFFSKIDESVNKVEARVTAASATFSVSSKAKKMLNSWSAPLLKKMASKDMSAEEATPVPAPAWEPIEVVDTKALIANMKADLSQKLQ